LTGQKLFNVGSGWKKRCRKRDRRNFKTFAFGNTKNETKRLLVGDEQNGHTIA